MGEPLGWVDPADSFRAFHEVTGLPVMISEFGVRGDDAGLPNSWPPPLLFYTVDTQERRADYFEGIARAAPGEAGILSDLGIVRLELGDTEGAEAAR